jgi:hypothetical protein
MSPLPAAIPALPEGASMAIWPLALLAADPGRAAVAGPAAFAGTDPEPPLYCNGGKWLYPLFDLLDLLSGAAGDEERATLASHGELFLRDRVIGRAAAFLILRAGIRVAYADLVSDGAAGVFDAAGATVGWGERIPAIGCATESLLADVADGEVAWEILQARRAASRGTPRRPPEDPAG